MVADEGWLLATKRPRTSWHDSDSLYYGESFLALEPGVLNSDIQSTLIVSCCHYAKRVLVFALLTVIYMCVLSLP